MIKSEKLLYVVSDLGQVDALCADAKTMLDNRGESEHAFAVDLLLREFVNNAILHGHASASDKHAKVTVRINRSWIKIQVTDQGPGFNWRLKKKSQPEDDATSGRGLAIGLHYARRMHYNCKGNQVTLWIKKAIKGAIYG